MTEGQPQPAALDLQELKKEASKLIGIFTQKTDLNGSIGFNTEDSNFSITHVIQKNTEILNVLKFPRNGGYGEEHLTIANPIGSGPGAPVIRFEVFKKGQDYQQAPDLTFTNSREAVDGAHRMLSELEVPIAA